MRKESIMDDDVKSPTVEETADSTSSVEEPQTTDAPQTPADATIEPEKVSKAVPYERFKEVNDQVKELRDMVSAITQQKQYQGVQEDIPDLDPDAAAAVDRRAREIFEQQENKKFEAKYANEFKQDPLLRAAFIAEAQKKMAQGEYIDRDAVLQQAKQALEDRINSKAQEAKEVGVKEGQDIAKTKQQLSAVGETVKQPEADPSKMSASELAKYMNIPRVD